MISLGTAPLGGWPGPISDEDAMAVVERAWDEGIRYFDTAPYYGAGKAERCLGAVLSTKLRDEFTVSTKVGRVLDAGRSESDFFKGGDPYTARFDFSYDGVMRSFEESLSRLRTDRVDIALIHDPDDHHEEALSGAYKALDRLRSDGTVGAVGVGMNVSEPLARFAHEADFDCFLLAGRYTLLEQDSLDDVLPAAEGRGMSIIVGGAFNSGVLAGGAHYDYAPAPKDVLAKARALGDVCASFGVPLRAAAMQFPLAHPVVSTVAVGCSTAAEVTENVQLMGAEIPGALWDGLREAGLIRTDAPTPQ